MAAELIGLRTERVESFGIHFRARHLWTTMAQEAMRAMQQQFTTALDSWTRQNIDLQAELVQGRQQGASERAALRQEVRTARVTEGGSRCGHTALKARRLLGCSRRVARLECSVLGLRWRSGATTPEADWKLRKQERRSQTPRSWRKEIGQHRKQLYWMMLMTCKGAALNIVFLASDSQGLEAWRQLTEKCEPKMRTRSAGQLMSILSFSLQATRPNESQPWNAR